MWYVQGRDIGLQEDVNGVLTVTPGGGLGKGERAGTKGKGGAKHEACDLVSNKEVVCEGLGSRCRENLSGGENIVWEIGGSGRR